MLLESAQDSTLAQLFFKVIPLSFYLGTHLIPSYVNIKSKINPDKMGLDNSLSIFNLKSYSSRHYHAIHRFALSM